MTIQINDEKSQVGSFVAGTLVHTQEGLRPIEQIKVGDYVLSQPETSAGELAYKRVTRTYEFDDKEIWYLCFTDINKQDHTLTGEVFATGDHPFWLAGFKSDWISEAQCNEEGIFACSWIHLQNIKPGMMLQLANGRLVTAEYPYRLIQMQFPKLAFFLTSNGNEPYYYGQVLSFAETVPQRCRGDIKKALGEVILCTCDPNSPGDYFNEGEEWEGISEVKWFKHKVYNLEVEDYHTYFVAKLGARVHAH